MRKPNRWLFVSVVLVAAGLAVSGLGAIRGVPIPYPTIQAAIDDAVTGVDTVLVAAGTYTESIDFGGKAITVRSATGPVGTIISGGGTALHVVAFQSGEGRGSVLDGFTITEGNATFGRNGGGIYCVTSSPSILNCVISNNMANGEGGGIYAEGSSLLLSGCTVMSNRCGFSYGGGIYVAYLDTTPVITNCSVSRNVGGGIACYYSGPLIVDCLVSNNTAGNGIQVRSGAFPTIVGSTICSNTTTIVGAGIYVMTQGSAIISNCTISGNRTTSEGGGVACYGTMSPAPTLVNCVISGNGGGIFGGGVWCEYSPARIVHCTISGNAATNAGGLGASQATSVVEVVNSIVWGNGTNQIETFSDGTVTASYCDVQNGWPGVSNLAADPFFVAPASYSNAPTMAGDYHLQSGGPCLDAGTNLPSVTVDRDGVTRPLDGNLDLVARWDMGAYEGLFWWADTDGDGMNDLWEFQRFGNATAGVPNVDSDGDGVINLREYVADTDPLNILDYFRVTAITNSDAWYVQFVSSTARVYSLQIMTNFVSWTPWSYLPNATNRPGLDGRMSLRDTNSAPRARAYRAQVQLP